MEKIRYYFGEWYDDKKEFTREDAIRVCELAEKNRQALASYPLDKIYALLEKLKNKWADPQYPHRVFLTQNLPVETGFSPEMIELGMKELSSTLDPVILRKKVATELGAYPPYGTGGYNGATGTQLEWHPLGTILHILSGNVFLVGVGSFLEGVLTRNVSILKMSSGEKIFLPRFVQSLQECDEDGVVSRSIALVDYRSNQPDVIAEFKKRVDGLVVWGGEEAVRSYRNDLPARTRVVVFGPKLSLGLVTKKGLDERDAQVLAQKAAFEISVWDQNACTAPQAFYIQGEENARRLAPLLARELEKISQEIPAGPTDLNTAVEIRKIQSVFEVAEARGKALLLSSKNKLDWTVVVDSEQTLDPSPLHRTIRLIPFENIAEILKQLAPLRGYIQTVGLAAGTDEYLALVRKLSEAGALRIVEVGTMFGGEIDDPHDGAYDLPQLMHLVHSRSSSGRHTQDYLPAEEHEALIDSRLRELLAVAQRSPFYSERLKGLNIRSVRDLAQVPSLTRGQMEANMPPQGNGLATGEYVGGYVSRSGGSTGTPKFSLYDATDWENMISHATRLFHTLGLRRGDRLANFMLAGDLYGSFVSFDHINARLGLTTFAFATSFQPQAVLDVWRKFNINVIQGIPTTLIPLLRELKEREPDFTVEKFIFAGSPLSQSDAAWLKNELKVKRIASVIGANDGGQIAFQCEKQSGALHHTVDDFNYMEIVNEEGLPVPPGQTGRILITSLLKFAYPLIRYEIGDQGRFITEPCGCGRTARVFEYQGRADDVLAIGLMNLSYRDIRESIQHLGISELQVAARNELGGSEYLVIRAETEDTSDKLKEALRKTIRQRIPKLQERLDDGALSRLSIELFNPGQLPRNSRSGKIKALIDERT